MTIEEYIGKLSESESVGAPSGALSEYYIHEVSQDGGSVVSSILAYDLSDTELRALAPHVIRPLDDGWLVPSGAVGPPFC